MLQHVQTKPIYVGFKIHMKYAKIFVYNPGELKLGYGFETVQRNGMTKGRHNESEWCQDEYEKWMIN